MGDFPNSELTAMLFQSHDINYLNQFLEQINDWEEKTKRVVENLMGYHIDIWLNPIGSRL